VRLRRIGAGLVCPTADRAEHGDHDDDDDQPEPPAFEQRLLLLRRLLPITTGSVLRRVGTAGVSGRGGLLLGRPLLWALGMLLGLGIGMLRGLGLGREREVLGVLRAGHGAPSRRLLTDPLSLVEFAVRRVRRQAGSFSRSVDGVQPTGGLHASVPAVTILLCLIIPLLSPTAAAGPLSPAPPYPVPSPVVVPSVRVAPRATVAPPVPAPHGRGSSLRACGSRAASSSASSCSCSGCSVRRWR